MVSVIIPSYNRQSSIKRSVLSVLDQTYRDLEVIVVDDGSTDETKREVESIGDPRVRYVYQENQGACTARNLGASLSKGEYIAFQDSDDTWRPNKLERQVAVLDRDPSVDIVCCQTLCTRADGSFFISMKDAPEGILSVQRGPFGISTQALVMRRKVFDRVRFDPRVTRYQDLDFMLTAMKTFTVYCVGDTLVDRYIGSDSITNHPERTYNMAGYFSDKYREDIGSGGKLASFLSDALVQAAAERKRSGGSCREYLALAAKMNPSFRTKVKAVAVILNLYYPYKKLTDRAGS